MHLRVSVASANHVPLNTGRGRDHMPRVKRLTPAAEWSELSTTAADWKAADPALLATMLGQLHLIRAFEETVLELAGEGLVHGAAPSLVRQEGGAGGLIPGLRSSDAVN